MAHAMKRLAAPATRIVATAAIVGGYVAPCTNTWRRRQWPPPLVARIVVASPGANAATLEAAPTPERSDGTGVPVADARGYSEAAGGDGRPAAVRQASAGCLTFRQERNRETTAGSR